MLTDSVPASFGQPFTGPSSRRSMPRPTVASPTAPAVQQTRRDYTPAEVLKTPVVWVMSAMFVWWAQAV